MTITFTSDPATFTDPTSSPTFNRGKIDELTTFIANITCSSDDANIGNLVVSNAIITSDSGINVTFGGDTFTIAGQFQDQFVRTINYLDNNLNKKTVTKFSDLPTGLGSIYEYIAPTDAYKIANVDITLLATISSNSSTSNTTINTQYEIIVRNNWQAANAALVNATITKDKF